MTPAELRAELAAIGWGPIRLAEVLGVSRQTVTRWLAGEFSIPAPVGAWLGALAACHRANPPPPIERSLRARGRVT
jgi:transcriptional regulator with XRE-family HTH domain